MSKWLLVLEFMAEHSMCQPGRPGPQGLSQVGSPGLDIFHSTKSSGLRLASHHVDPGAGLQLLQILA